jgi:hypothetical protein
MSLLHMIRSHVAILRCSMHEAETCEGETENQEKRCILTDISKAKQLFIEYNRVFKYNTIRKHM